MRDLVIDRSKWHNATYFDNRRSALLTKEGTMCCLGFMCKALGADNISLWLKAFPSGLFSSDNSTVEDIKSGIEQGFPIGYNGDDKDTVYTLQWATNAAGLNDRTGITPQEREDQLIALFKDNGWNLSFEGDYPEKPFDYRVKIDYTSMTVK